MKTILNQGSGHMSVSYNKLWKMLIDKKMKRIELMEAAGIGTTTLSKLGKDQYVSMEVLVKICKVLNCNIGDIVDIVND
jgi:putative transcriptional regulator